MQHAMRRVRRWLCSQASGLPGSRGGGGEWSQPLDGIRCRGGVALPVQRVGYSFTQVCDRAVIEMEEPTCLDEAAHH